MSALESNRKVVVVLFVCFGSLLASTLSTFYEQSRNYNQALAVRENLDFCLELEKLVHEVQQERGLSVTWRSAPDNNVFREKVFQQRQYTDKVVEGLQAFASQLPDPEDDDIVNQCVSHLSTARKSVDQEQSPADVLESYTTTVDFSHATTASLLKRFSGREAILATTIQSLSIAKEGAGLERALVASALAEGVLTTTKRKHIQRLVSRQETQLGFTESLLEEGHRQALGSVVTSPVFMVPTKIRDQILDSDSTADLSSAKQWWALQTAKIDELHFYQTLLVNEIRQRVGRQLSASSRKWYGAATLATIPLLTFIGLVYATRRQQDYLEDSLKRSKERESTLLKDCREAVFVMTDGRIQDCNDQLLRLLKLESKDLVIGSKPENFCWERQPDNQSVGECWAVQIRKVIQEGHTRFECCFKDHHGESILTEVTLTKVDDTNGSTIIGLLYNIGEQRRIEQQLADARKLESIGQLSTGIAHEINTPMQCVLSNLEFIQEEISDMQREEWLERSSGPLLEATEDSVKASRRIIEIVRAMKTMSRHGKVEKEFCDLNTLLRDAIIISTNRWDWLPRLKQNWTTSLGLFPLTRLRSVRFS